MTQCEAIIRYCEENGSITTLEAVSELGILRLASRIYDLTKLGVSFSKERVQGKNRYGMPISFVRYTLDG